MPAIVYDFDEIAGKVLGDDWFPKVSKPPAKAAGPEYVVFVPGSWAGKAAGGGFEMMQKVQALLSGQGDGKPS